MTERERLIELLKHNNCSSPMLCDPNCKYAELQRCYEERTADYLLANGVILSPLKLNDTVWVLEESGYITEYKIFRIDSQVVKENTYNIFYGHDDNNVYIFSTEEGVIGITVFLTKEEAEKALEEKKKE